jgi:dTDP-4-amino-4,6-dideoxygalactose transaminase
MGVNFSKVKKEWNYFHIFVFYMKIPFSPPFINEYVIQEVLDSLNSGWITTGPKVSRLEDRMAHWIGVEKALCVNSASAGMQLMLEWFGVGPGDEVIIPAYTYASTATAVLHCGATPVMVDTDPGSFELSIKNVENVIGPKTKAIIPVDIGGWPCDYDALYQLIHREDLRNLFTPHHPRQQQLGRILIMADAAHSIGSEYKGRPVGKLADLTVISLHAVKNITSAEGGVILFNLPAPFQNEEAYRTNKIISQNGHSKNVHEKALNDGWRYDIVDLGKKINMTDLGAAIALAQLDQWDEMQRRRIEIFNAYTQELKSVRNIRIPQRLDNIRSGNGHLFMIQLLNTSVEKRDHIISEMKDLGIALNVHFVSLPQFTYFQSLGYLPEDYPNAVQLSNSEISLPIYPQLTDEQVHFLLKSLNFVLSKLELG